MKKTLLILVLLVGTMTSLASVDSLRVVYRSNDSLALMRAYTITSSSGIIQTVITNTITQWTDTSYALVAQGVYRDTLGFGPLQAGSPYHIVMKTMEFSGIDSLVLDDSTLSSPQSIGPVILGTPTISSVSTMYTDVSVPWNKNGSNTIFLTWQWRDVSGGSWVTDSVVEDWTINQSGVSTYTFLGLPGDSIYVRVLGLGLQDTTYTNVVSDSVLVVFLELPASPPSFISTNATQISSSGASVSFTISADSIGGVRYVESSTDPSFGSSVTTYPIAGYTSGVHTYTYAVSGYQPMTTVYVRMRLISSNSNWSTVDTTVSFTTTGGAFEIVLDSVHAYATSAMGYARYASGGNSSNTLWFYVYSTSDTVNPVAFSSLMSSLPQGNYTPYSDIVSGLSSNNCYYMKVFMFNSIGYTESPAMYFCTQGVTGVDEHALTHISLYPNPAKSFISLRGYKGIISVMNMAGSIVLETHVESEEQLPINLPSGLYVVRGEGWLEKLIVE